MRKSVWLGMKNDCCWLGPSWQQMIKVDWSIEISVHGALCRLEYCDCFS